MVLVPLSTGINCMHVVSFSLSLSLCLSHSVRATFVLPISFGFPFKVYQFINIGASVCVCMCTRYPLLLLSLFGKGRMETFATEPTAQTYSTIYINACTEWWHCNAIYYNEVFELQNYCCF